MVKNLIGELREKFAIIADKYGSKNIGICFVALFLLVVVFTAAGCTGNNVDVVATPDGGAQNVEAQGAPSEGVGAGSPAQIAGEESSSIAVEKGNKVDSDGIEVIANQNDKMVTMSVEDSGRSNPFMPFGESAPGSSVPKNVISLQDQKLKYDLLDPPEDVVEDEDAKKVLTTKVSGIMYDKQNPSAILNIENSDYLVRSGDVVNGYKMLSISPISVTVQLGANIYKAGVGELLTSDGIQYNTISNLNKKFGGGKK